MTLTGNGQKLSAFLDDQWNGSPAYFDNSGSLKLDIYQSINFTAKTISHNAGSGDLAEDKEETDGAFLPVNNDDDDYDSTNTADKDQAGAITGENDLLPVLLPKLATSAAGSYKLDISAGFKVWKKSDRSDEVTSTTSIPANNDTTVYVEATTKGSGVLKLNWSDGTTTVTDGDRIKLTAFEWTGPLNVPGYSIYNYKATGAIAGSKWVTPGDGTIKAGANTSDVKILWGEGPVVGKAIYEVNDKYTWDLGVNVVQIKFKATGNSATYADKIVNAPVQVGGANGLQIESSSAANAMTSQIELDDVIGPTVGGVQRGRRFIELGHVHQTEFVHKEGFFGTINYHKRSTLQDGKRHWDAAFAATLPWTFDNTGHYLDIISDSQAVAGHRFKTFDNPKITFSDQLINTGDQIDEAKIVMPHWTYIAVRSKDSRVLELANPLFQLAELNWNVDTSGTIDAAGVYALTGSGVTGDTSYAMVVDGSLVPGADGNMNESFANQMWYLI